MSELNTPTHPCTGCRSWFEIDEEMTCLNATSWPGGIPSHPPCHVTEKVYTSVETEVRARIKQRWQELAQLHAALSPVQRYLIVEEVAIEALIKHEGEAVSYGIELAAHLIAAGAAAIPESTEKSSARKLRLVVSTDDRHDQA